VKIALLTSRLAYGDVYRKAREVKEKYSNITINVYALPIEVIAGLDVELMKKLILKDNELFKKLRESDVILIPGTVKGDAYVLEDLIGKKVYKATRSIELLENVIKYIIEGKELDRIKPAEDVITNTIIELVKKFVSIKIKNNVAFEINGLKIPFRGPPIVIASETSTSLSPEKAGEQALMFEEEGADIIVIGIPFNEDQSSYRKRIDYVLKKVNKAVVGIESENPKAIVYGIEHGVSIVFGLYPSIMDNFVRYKREVAFTVLPCDFKDGVYPSSWRDSINFLLNNIAKAENLGFEKIAADLILHPPLKGFVKSIVAYYLARDKVDKPLAACISNITELFEADSHSINALLSAIACEVGLSILSITEDSWRTRYSTLETRVGLAMNYSALAQKNYPLNVGVDLCVVKESIKPKSSLDLLYNANDIKDVARNSYKEKLDNWGYVLIGIDYDENKIIACIVKYSGSKICYLGSKAKNILYRILSDHKEFSQKHAGYLGAELEKAEIALKLGIKYVQDEDLFKKLYDFYKDKIKDIDLRLYSKQS